MNAIIGLNNIAMNDATASDKVKEYLGKIDASAHHLLGIINDILDMSRIESGRMVIKNEEFSFSKYLEQVNNMISGQCRDKGLHFECRTIGKIDDYYIGDAMKLKQVMLNILGNAVKFTPEGGEVTFLIEEGRRYDGKATLHFTFRDSGIGISKEFLPHIFDWDDISDEAKAAGVDTFVPKPLFAGNVMDEFREAFRRKNEALEKRTVDLKGRRVLVAEDVAVNAEIMLMVLTMREIEADVAENGRIAVDTFSAHEPGYYDAILMDMRMPEMDGLEAAKCIRAMDRPDAKKIPIIALTANAFDEDVQRSLQAGLNAHLSKPIEPEALFETLEKLI